MKLQPTWRRIETLTEQLHTAIRAESDRAPAVWHQRQQLLESLFNRSHLDSLSTEDLTWLQERSEVLQQSEQAVLASLNEQQQAILQSLRQQQGNARAAEAYRQQQG